MDLEMSMTKKIGVLDISAGSSRWHDLRYRKPYDESKNSMKTNSSLLGIVGFIFVAFCSPSSYSAPLCPSAHKVKPTSITVSKWARANENRIERASLLLNRELNDNEIIAILNAVDNKVDDATADLLLMEAKFKSAERKALIEAEIATASKKIVFSQEQWSKIESDFLQNPETTKHFSEVEISNMRSILQSGKPDMGSKLAEALGHSVLVHQTKLSLMHILKRGAVLPGRNVTDKNLIRLAHAYAQDFGRGALSTFSYNHAFFQPMSPRWQNVKLLQGNSALIFDLKLFDDPVSEFNVFFNHSSPGRFLRTNPTGFLSALRDAYGMNQSELKTPTGISLKQVKYIVVAPENRAFYLSQLAAEGLAPPEGRRWRDIIKASPYILGNP